jgi:hypothetical protein
MEQIQWPMKQKPMSDSQNDRQMSPEFAADYERTGTTRRAAEAMSPGTERDEWVRHTCATPGCGRVAFTHVEDYGRADRSHECTKCWTSP